MKLVQSAHVSVHPRAARSQQVRTLNFRIIGPNLAEDYALLGDEGFNFSIERFVAGERKNVLFRANSLMDLLHTGAAKIFSNVRRRAVEFEKSEIYPAYENDFLKYLVPGEYEVDDGYKFTENYEGRRSLSKSTGWRSSETGQNLNLDSLGVKGFEVSPSTPFESYGNQETRIHTQLLFPIDKGPWSFLRNYFGLIADITSRGFIKPRDILISTNNLYHGGWANKHWKGVAKKDLYILGVNQVSTSPFSQLRAINDLIDFGREIENPVDFVATMGELLLSNLFLIATGGVNSTLSISPAGIGIGMAVQPYPHLSHSASYGTSGNITKQAFETKYSFNQFLQKGGDDSKSKTIITGGEMKRVVTRKEVPNTDRQRVKGAEVMWQGELADIITGSIPLNLTLPATAGKMHFRTSDDSLRVRFGSGVGRSISVDFWFDLTEEVIRDDN